MYITRVLHGNVERIDLSKEEIRQAYEEQQAIYDKEDVLDAIEGWEDGYVEDVFGITEQEYIDLADDIAAEKRRLINKYDMYWQEALGEATDSVIKNYKSQKAKQGMVLYTAPFCPKCDLAKTTLMQAGYQFRIEKDTEKALELGIKVAPCLVTGTGKQYGLKDIISICKGEGSFV